MFVQLPSRTGTNATEGEAAEREMSSLIDVEYFLSLSAGHRSILAGLSRLICSTGLILESFPLDPALAREYQEQLAANAAAAAAAGGDGDASFVPERNTGEASLQSLEEFLQALMPSRALRGAGLMPTQQPNQLFPLAGASVSEFAWLRALGEEHSFRAGAAGYDSYNKLSYAFLLRSTHHPQASGDEFILPDRVDTWIEPERVGSQCDLYIMGEGDRAVDQTWGKELPRLVNSAGEEFKGFVNLQPARAPARRGQKEQEGEPLPPHHISIVAERNSVVSFLSEDLTLSSRIPFLAVLLAPAVDWFLGMFMIQLTDWVNNKLDFNLLAKILDDAGGDKVAGSGGNSAGDLMGFAFVEGYEPALDPASAAAAGLHRLQGNQKQHADLFTESGVAALEYKLEALQGVKHKTKAKAKSGVVTQVPHPASSSAAADSSSPSAHGTIKLSREVVHPEMDLRGLDSDLDPRWAQGEDAEDRPLSPSEKRRRWGVRGTSAAQELLSAPAGRTRTIVNVYLDSDPDAVVAQHLSSAAPHHKQAVREWMALMQVKGTARAHAKTSAKHKAAHKALAKAKAKSRARGKGKQEPEGEEVAPEGEGGGEEVAPEGGGEEAAAEGGGEEGAAEGGEEGVAPEGEGEEGGGGGGGGADKAPNANTDTPSTKTGEITRPLATSLIMALSPKIGKSLAESLHKSMQARINNEAIDGTKQWLTEQLTIDIARDVVEGCIRALRRSIPKIVNAELPPTLINNLRTPIHASLSRSLSHAVGLSLHYTLRDVGRQEPVCYYCEFIDVSYCKLCYRSRNYKYQKYEDLYAMDYCQCNTATINKAAAAAPACGKA